MQAVIVSGFLAVLLCVSSLSLAADDGAAAGEIQPVQQTEEGTAVRTPPPKPQALNVHDIATLTALGGAVVFVALGAALMFNSLAHPFALRRYWGGFGGETSGWEFSPGLARLLAGLVMLSIGATLGWQIMNATRPGGGQVAAEQSESASKKGSDAATQE